MLAFGTEAAGVLQKVPLESSAAQDLKLAAESSQEWLSKGELLTLISHV